MTKVKLIAVKQGWAMQRGDVRFEPTANAHVLGTLIWALGAEAAYQTLEGEGDVVLVQLAEYWSTLIGKRPATPEHQKLDVDFVLMRVEQAAELAPTSALAEMVRAAFTERTKQIFKHPRR